MDTSVSPPQAHMMATQGTPEAYLVKWGNHSDGMFKVISNLPLSFLSDVTLHVENEEIPCHRLVLVAGSKYFYQYFLMLEIQNNATGTFSTGPHVIPIENYSSRVVKAALQLMYDGEANVRSEDLRQFLDFARAIHLRGCVPDDYAQQTTETTSVAGPSATTTAAELMASLLHGLPSPNSSILSGKSENGNNSQDSGIDVEDEASGPVDLTLGKQEMRGGSEDELDGSAGSDRNVGNIHDDSDDSEASRTVSALSEKSISDENILRREVEDISAEWQKDPLLLEKLARLNTTVSVAKPFSNPHRGTRKYKNYNQEVMKMAVADVISNKCTAQQAAKIYNVPNRTLYDQVKRQSNANKRNPDLKVEANVSVDDILHKVSKASGSSVKKGKSRSKRVGKRDI